MTSMTPQEVVQHARVELKERGIRAALELVNRHSGHRFTALFRFEGGTLRNLHLIDRDDPTVERSPDLPVLESYCVYVRNTAQTFVTNDSMNDPRVDGHPKQKSVQSYCGIPLVEPDGTLFGTMCHFDYEPRPFAVEEVWILEEIAPDLIRRIRGGEWKAERRSA